jgi:hypothetical protein
MAYPPSTRRRILPEQAPYRPLSSPHQCFPYAPAGAIPDWPYLSFIIWPGHDDHRASGCDGLQPLRRFN